MTFKNEDSMEDSNKKLLPETDDSLSTSNSVVSLVSPSLDGSSDEQISDASVDRAYSTSLVTAGHICSTTENHRVSTADNILVKAAEEIPLTEISGTYHASGSMHNNEKDAGAKPIIGFPSLQTDDTTVLSASQDIISLEHDPTVHIPTRQNAPNLEHRTPELQIPQCSNSPSVNTEIISPTPRQVDIDSITIDVLPIRENNHLVEAQTRPSLNMSEIKRQRFESPIVEIDSGRKISAASTRSHRSHRSHRSILSKNSRTSRTSRTSKTSRASKFSRTSAKSIHSHITESSRNRRGKNSYEEYSMDDHTSETFADVDQGYEDDDENNSSGDERQSEDGNRRGSLRVRNFLKPDFTPKLRLRKRKKFILPSQARNARMQAALSRRNYMIQSAWNVVRRNKMEAMKEEMREYYEELSKKVANFKDAKEKGMIVNEKEYLNDVKKMAWIEKRLKGNSFTEDIARTGKEQTWWIWKYLRGITTPYGKNPKSWKELARADRDQVKSLIIDLAYALGSYGMPAHRLDFAISTTSAFYGIDAEISVTLTQFLVTFHDFMLEDHLETGENISQFPSSKSFLSFEKEWRNLSHELDSDISEHVSASLHDASDDSSVAPKYKSRARRGSDTGPSDSNESNSDTNSNESGSRSHSRHDSSSSLNRSRSTTSRKSQHNHERKQQSKNPPSIEASVMYETEAQTKKIVRDEMSFLIQNSTHFIKLKSIGMDLDKLIRLEELCYLLYNGHITIKEARVRLQAIMKRNHLYSYAPVLFICHVLAAVSFCVIMQANYGEMICVAVATIFCTFLDILLTRIFSIFAKVFLPIAAISVGFIAIFMRWLMLDFSYVNVFLVSLCAVINYLPGYGFVTSIAELTERRNEAGLVRLSGVLMTMLQMGFGIALGTSLNQILLPHQTQPVHTNPLWLQTIGLVIATSLWAITFRIPFKIFSFIYIAISAVVVFYIAYAVNLSGVTFLGSFVGGLTTGLLGQIYSYLTRHPSIVVSSVVILQQVPGSSGVRAAAAFGDGDIMKAVEHFMNGLAISIAIVFGLMMGRLLLPINKKSSLQG